MGTRSAKMKRCRKIHETMSLCFPVIVFFIARMFSYLCVCVFLVGAGFLYSQQFQRIFNLKSFSTITSILRAHVEIVFIYYFHYHIKASVLKELQLCLECRLM